MKLCLGHLPAVQLDEFRLGKKLLFIAYVFFLIITAGARAADDPLLPRFLSFSSSADLSAVIAGADGFYTVQTSADLLQWRDYDQVLVTNGVGTAHLNLETNVAFFRLRTDFTMRPVVLGSSLTSSAKAKLSTVVAPFGKASRSARMTLPLRDGTLVLGLNTNSDPIMLTIADEGGAVFDARSTARALVYLAAGWSDLSTASAGDALVTNSTSFALLVQAVNQSISSNVPPYKSGLVLANLTNLIREVSYKATLPQAVPSLHATQTPMVYYNALPYYFFKSFLEEGDSLWIERGTAGRPVSVNLVNETRLVWHAVTKDVDSGNPIVEAELKRPEFKFFNVFAPTRTETNLFNNPLRFRLTVDQTKETEAENILHLMLGVLSTVFEHIAPRFGQFGDCVSTIAEPILNAEIAGILTKATRDSVSGYLTEMASHLDHHVIDILDCIIQPKNELFEILKEYAEGVSEFTQPLMLIVDGTKYAVLLGRIIEHWDETHTVEVIDEINRLEIVPRNPVVYYGQPLRLSVTAYDLVGSIVNVPPERLTWNSISPSYASVTSDGVVSAVSTGFSVITVKEAKSQRSANAAVLAGSPLDGKWVGSLTVNDYDGGPVTVPMTMAVNTSADGKLHSHVTTGPYPDGFNGFGDYFGTFAGSTFSAAYFGNESNDAIQGTVSGEILSGSWTLGMSADFLLHRP